METMDFETGSQALKALIRERSPLGALRVMHRRLGRIFQIPLPRLPSVCCERARGQPTGAGLGAQQGPLA